MRVVIGSNKLFYDIQYYTFIPALPIQQNDNLQFILFVMIYFVICLRCIILKMDGKIVTLEDGIYKCQLKYASMYERKVKSERVLTSLFNEK